MIRSMVIDATGRSEALALALTHKAFPDSHKATIVPRAQIRSALAVASPADRRELRKPLKR